MTLKELMKILPGWVIVSVHDSNIHDSTNGFKAQGNPHQFTQGIYRSHSEEKVALVVPIAPYHVEVWIEGREYNAPMA